jgi:AcrR family transcriptional regulator
LKQIEGTLSLLLESATAEFLENGYEKASLRTIAQNAGVTTGALYVRFPDKNALFAALVSPVADHLLSVYRAGNQQGFEQLEEGHPQDMWSISDSVVTELVEYIFANKTAFSLLINCSAGSSYENFMDELVAEEEKQSIAYLNLLQKDGHDRPQISEEELHVLISAQFFAIFEIVRHDTPKKDAIKRVRLIVDFFRPGWARIFDG